MITRFADETIVLRFGHGAWARDVCACVAKSKKKYIHRKKKCVNPKNAFNLVDDRTRYCPHEDVCALDVVPPAVAPPQSVVSLIYVCCSRDEEGCVRETRDPAESQVCPNNGCGEREFKIKLITRLVYTIFFNGP